MPSPEIETQTELDRLVEDCRVVMDKASAAGRDLTAAELQRVKSNASEFDRIRAKSRFAPQVQDKADLRARLRYVGLSRAAADRVATAGWPELSPESAIGDAVAMIRAAAGKLQP
jgi:hypothetical protein